MTSEEFRFWLKTIHWTIPQLAEILGCDISYVEALDRGDVEAPPLLTAWLRTLGKVHAELEAPIAYRRKKWKPKNNEAKS